MNLVLYRKYRPRTFSEFIGQVHIVKTITNAIAGGMISHAYLFSGPRGSGKTTLARLLAKAINCQNRQEGQFEPCDKCSSCEEINRGHSMDLIEIDAASHRGIDNIRDLKGGIRFVPSKSKYKVFIIDEAHQLSKDAANALLKTLEEPPKHAIFILATTEVHKMISTIVSRCQRFDFAKLKVGEIVKKLEMVSKKEKIKIEKAALEIIAKSSRGSFRDAESLLDQALSFSNKNEIKADDIKDILGLIETELMEKLLELIVKKDAAEAIKFLNEAAEQGTDLQEFGKAFVDYLRQALLLKIVSKENAISSDLTKEETERLRAQIEKLDSKQISQILENFLDASNRIRYSPIPQLPIELAIIESCELK